MSQENVEIVRRAFEASARRDADAVLALYDPEVEWDASRTQSGLEDAVHRGHDGLRRFFRQWREAWDSDEYEYEELIDADMAVVSVATQRGRGRASGLRIARPLVGVWTIENGLIVRVVWFLERSEALEAVGLSE
jgi:uncharacterized protein